MSGPGQTGYIYHFSSGILVHPSGGSENPRNDTKLVIYRSNRDAVKRLRVKFVPVEGKGHFGYIEHVSSGKVVHPRGGKPNPSNDTSLVYHSDKSDAALFTFDEGDKRIIHKGGKIWHPRHGSLNPSNDTACVLHSDKHNAAKFYFGDINGKPISPYPEKMKLGGDWKMIKTFKVSNSLFYSGVFAYKVGRSVSVSAFEDQNFWNMDEKDVRTLFEADEKYRSFAEKADSRTWMAEREETREFSVKGETLVIWQYEFTVSQYGETCAYRSGNIAQTSSLDEKPFYDKNN